jgi:nickel-dependent lactate racemase
MKIKIPHHKEFITLELPPATADKTRVISGPGHNAPAIGPAEILAALQEPIGTATLAVLAQGKRSACIVISDITRPVPNKLLLPPLLNTLEAAGIDRENICILIATGMHRPNEGEELIELVGAEIAANYQIINHDCHDRDNLRQILTIDGANIEVNGHYLDAELKILTGLIEPHPFAGFSGGGKSILPGISSFNTMRFMHSFALVDHPQVETARIQGNPFRQHINSVCSAAGVDFIVNVILDHNKQPTAVFAGDQIDAFEAGCATAAQNAVVKIGEPADLVITSGGGYPLDATFYQSTKGLIAAGQILRPGGTILLIAGCSEGLGSQSYRDIIDSAKGSPAEFRRIYSDPDNFIIDQWGAQVYFQTLEKADRILLYAPGLTQDQLTPFGVELIADLDATLSQLCAESEQIYIVPEGPYVASIL